MKTPTMISVVAVIFTAGCGSDEGERTVQAPDGAPSDGYYGPMRGPMMRGPRVSGSELRFKSNGQRIYYTATSTSDEPVTATEGPHWFQMHGGSCVDCHGPDGQGGYVVPMTNVVAPNITYEALTSEHHGMQGEEEHPPYTEATIERAITEGVDPAGEPLDYAMPRWNMTSNDIDDLVAYLKTLGNSEGSKR